MGGKGEIAVAEEESTVSVVSEEKHMYVVLEADGYVDAEEVLMSKSNLASDHVFIVDCGHDLYVWVGKASTNAERGQSMLISYSFLEELGRSETTRVHRVKEGQEHQCQHFLPQFE